MRIPETDYKALSARWHSFDWFIPSVVDHAGVYSFPWCRKEKGFRSQAIVLYLSPTLEERPEPFAIASIAHELAHIFLRHSPHPSFDQASSQEKAA
jgi:hypothetical protein